MNERTNFICFVEPCFLRNQHWVLFNFQFTKDREINVCIRRGNGVVVREEHTAGGEEQQEQPHR